MSGRVPDVDRLPYVRMYEGAPVPAGTYIGWTELRAWLLLEGVERAVLDNVDLALLDPDNREGTGFGVFQP